MKRQLHRIVDRKRCRYTDCVEQHPEARDKQRVTCATCREYMGLPQLPGSY